MKLLAICAIGNLIAQNNHQLHVGVVVIMKRRIAIIIKAFRLNYHINAAIDCSPW
jgi:hypothetical protein